MSVVSWNSDTGTEAGATEDPLAANDGVFVSAVDSDPASGFEGSLYAILRTDEDEVYTVAGFRVKGGRELH